HLARPDGTRIWLTPPSFALRDVARDLTLDGTQEELSPDGLNEIIYADLVHDLRQEGFVVHAFAFDFRRRARDIAADLAEALIALGPDRRFVFVAHSMGAIVAAMYPYVDPDWEGRVERAIFLGGTLGGTFEVVDAALGHHPIIGRLSHLSMQNDPAEYAACMRTWPGLYDMLPDPSLFSGGEKAFDPEAWPDAIRPAKGLLEDAKKTREQLKTSPLFDIPTAQILSVRFSTADEYDSNGIGPASRDAMGDGTVPARTAGFGGADVYRVELPHTLIPMDPAAIRAVIDLVTTGETELPRVTDDEKKGRVEGTEPTLDDIVWEYLLTTFANPARMGRVIWLCMLLGPPKW
ncbi:MAG: alpha/beta fold hydrolase, partial [Phycisphaerales bacterium]|nr:alpha/beta fold hydrolase [Phycisphaerales bacterium]